MDVFWIHFIFRSTSYCKIHFNYSKNNELRKIFVHESVSASFDMFVKQRRVDAQLVFAFWNNSIEWDSAHSLNEFTHTLKQVTMYIKATRTEAKVGGSIMLYWKWWCWLAKLKDCTFVQKERQIEYIHAHLYY